MNETRIEEVHYALHVLDGPDPGWRVRRLYWSEGLSQVYEIVLDLVTTDVAINTDEILGASVELLVTRGGLSRVGYGVVHRVDDLGVATQLLAARVYVVPALALLGQRIDTRIFQGMTTPEILKEVLTPALDEYGRTLELERGLAGDYEARDCCVQFRESDLDFCRRLMEEEGIAFYFEADDDNACERLTIADHNEAYAAVLLDSDEVPIITERAELAELESLQSLELTRSERINKVSTRGFNWKLPTALDEGQEGEADARGRTREHFAFDDRRQIVDDPLGDPRAESFTGEQLAQRGPMASHRLELHSGRVRTCAGSSNVTGFVAGGRFMLGDHHREDLALHEFLITRVVHRGAAPDADIGAQVEEARYANQVECVPFEQVFRPRRVTPRPRVYGAQTAIVMGPSDDSSEDIHTDRHGRIKVRFHWDRLSPEDGTASCWVRVGQTWAGRGWGTMFIPRVGMEVVVEFLDGNPDRPLVIGCVYNGDQAPPYTLPDDKTKSTIKSDSSPGGGGFNELRFEDAKGSEELFLHAQKDFNETVLEDHSTQVGANQSNTVGGDQSETVSGNQTMTVEHNRSVTVIGSQSVTIQGAEAEDGVSGSKLAVTGDWIADASNTVEVQAPTHIKLTCGGSVIEMVPGKITLSAGGSAQLVLDANALMESAAGSKVLLDANALTQSSGNSKVSLDASALTQSSGGSKVLLDANALTQSSGGSKVLLDGNALMSSPGTGTVQAPTATLAGGGGSVEASGAGVTCAGGQVNVSGGMVNVSGGMVSIN